MVQSTTPSITTADPPEILAAGSARRRPPPSGFALKKGAACRACRARKTKCDTIKPICFGCISRETEEQCIYDTETKHRGPDRRVGQRPRRRIKTAREIEVSPSTTASSTSRESDGPPDDLPDTSGSKTVITQHRSNGCPNTSVPAFASMGKLVLTLNDEKLHVVVSTDSLQKHEVASHEADPETKATDDLYVGSLSGLQSVTNGNFILQDEKILWSHAPTLPSEPSISFFKKNWWDQLLELFDPDRATASRMVVEDLYCFFRTNTCFLTFIHRGSFFDALFNPESRQRVQPALILSMLAVTAFIKSSSTSPAIAHPRAMILRDAAQAALDASIQAQALELPLVQAALVLTFFELHPHHLYSDSRVIHAVHFLDSLVRALQLPCADVDHPRASVFPPEVAPSIPQSGELILSHEIARIGISLQANTDATPCLCGSLTCSMLSQNEPSSAWDTSDPKSIRAEESRRTCWSSLRIAACCLNLQSFDSQPSVSLFLTEASNYALLFPGEALAASTDPNTPTGSKNWIFSLEMRSAFLFCSCTSLDKRLGTRAEKEFFALQVLSEIEKIESLLQIHAAGSQEYSNCRQYLQRSRGCVSYHLRRPVPSRGQDRPNYSKAACAQGYAYHLEKFLQRERQSSAPTDGEFRRLYTPIAPLQHLRRCLTLWSKDRSLPTMLEIGNQLVPFIYSIISHFPHTSRPVAWFRQMCIELISACEVTGVTVHPFLAQESPSKSWLLSSPSASDFDPRALLGLM